MSAIRLKRILIFRTKVWCSLSLTVFPEIFLSPLITKNHAPRWNYKIRRIHRTKFIFHIKNVETLGDVSVVRTFPLVLTNFIFQDYHWFVPWQTVSFHRESTMKVIWKKGKSTPTFMRKRLKIILWTYWKNDIMVARWHRKMLHRCSHESCTPEQEEFRYSE